MILGGVAVIASSATQRCVTLSTCEVEYVAMVGGAKTIFFTSAVLVILQPQLFG